jgi:DNA-binding LytR/AlgR family response regulator
MNSNVCVMDNKIIILAIEDDPIQAQSLELTVAATGHKLARVVDNGTDALALHKSIKPDLVLMDITIRGELNGIEVAERMNEFRPTPIIFVTSRTDPSAFEQAKAVIPLAFLTKPLVEINLIHAIELAIGRINRRAQYRWENDVVFNDSFFVKDQNRLIKIKFADIIQAIVEGKHVNIVTAEKSVQVRIALKDLEKQMPANTFLRVHRNHLVNTDKIDNIDLENNLMYLGSYAVPLGVTYRDFVLRQLNALQ